MGRNKRVRSRRSRVAHDLNVQTYASILRLLDGLFELSVFPFDLVRWVGDHVLTVPPFIQSSLRVSFRAG